MASETIISFDAYGTLLSTDSIAKELSKHFGEEKALAVASTWRRYQLEYTWRLNGMNQYLDFQTVTSNSLHQALAESSLSLSKEAIDGVIRAYDSLSAFPDVAPCLKALSTTSGITAVVFSNGTNKMVSKSVRSSPDLSHYADVFRRIVTVEEVECYKPRPEVYHHLAEQVGKSKTREGMGEMWLVSGNPFDIVGARAVGMRAIWVNRGSSDWMDNLMGGYEVGKPTATVRSLEEVLDVVKANGKT